jgi:hypothetical protein
MGYSGLEEVAIHADCNKQRDTMQNFGRGPKNPQMHTRTRSNSTRPGAQRRPSGGNGFANAKRNYEHYISLARAATSAGDELEAENCYQHADHYFRMMRES